MACRTNEVAKFAFKSDLGKESKMVHPAAGQETGETCLKSKDVQRRLEKGFQFP